MASLFEDQAAGLRKLFAGARGPTGVAFAGSVERGALVAALARALASAGKDVLVIDERGGAGNVTAAFGLRSRFDLLQAVNRDVPAAQVLLRPEPAIRLLPAARAARRHARLGAMERRALAEWLRRLRKGVDFVLADTAPHPGADFLPQPQRIVVALSPEGAAVTQAYAQIKRLAQERGCRRFGIAVLGPADPAEGRTVFDNLREVAGRHLGAELELIGATGRCGDAAGLAQALAESLLDAPRMAAPKGFSAARPLFEGAKAAHPVV